jgi:hypothetical protein
VDLVGVEKRHTQQSEDRARLSWVLAGLFRRPWESNGSRWIGVNGAAHAHIHICFICGGHTYVLWTVSRATGCGLGATNVGPVSRIDAASGRLSKNAGIKKGPQCKCVFRDGHTTGSNSERNQHPSHGTAHTLCC